ncbi:Fur family transcriptional regulator [Sulfuricaulis limicola]|uniref:Ferric uptake regulation protein n=1 Tax=Sulfuricaulis limicola TaxID=1620215 RepID=A0A1B4XEL4_9GAMM|nr:Fur family transcriptional regulator [Sulfuricaulis limicola]BAV33249.1 Fur family transcriptional regulator [Sulfuricaulis limicola]
MSHPESEAEIVSLLRNHDIYPTTQRVIIARLLFEKCTHLSAEDVFRLVNADNRHVSKATVYNTLGLLAEKGVVREVIADPTRIFYDPNTQPHHHFFDVATGELTDISADQIQVSSLPPLPPGARLEGVDVIVRLRPAK